MNNIILVIISIFFVIGAIDYFNNNKFQLGQVFKEGINNMGPLAISMIGIISLTPIAGDMINKYIIPVAEIIKIDASIFSSSILAIDMGALNIAKEIAVSNEMMIFSGVLMGSMIGCTISFTLPLALGMIKDHNRKFLCTGLLSGVAVLPFGLFIGGLMLRINIKTIITNMIPIIIIAIILSVGLVYKQELTIKIFNVISKSILAISLFGFILQGIQSILGIEIIKNMMPLEEAMITVGKISIFLGGAYVMIEWIRRTFSSKFMVIENKYKINGYTISAFIGSLASAIVVFSAYDKLDDKGKVMCAAFTVGGAYVFGGQMGYVASETPEILTIYILTKLICGILAVVFASYIINYKSKKESK
ncbi:MAG: ethanolamine utilization protein EutH [Clostridium sp.]